jgi:RNA polymerase sigma-54 factor
VAIGPRLDLRQSQSLVMTPQLQQAIKLLTLSNLEVEAFIGEALDANPLLDMAEGGIDADLPIDADLRRTHLETSPVDQLVGEGRAAEDQPLDIDPASLDRDRDTGDGDALVERARDRSGDSGDWSASGGTGADTEGPGIEGHGDGEASLAAHLHAQIGATTRDPQLLFIARWLIDQLDEAGYLIQPLAETAAMLDVPPDRAEAALMLVQTLDPTGIGARDLGECLALQAREADRYDPCMARLLANLDLVGKGDLARLQRLCGVDDEDFSDMLAELRGYDPKPGLRFGGGVAEAIVPDILVRAVVMADGASGFEIAINQATLPRLIVNRRYFVEMRGACVTKEARAWLGERLADANWLLKALDQRQKTILKVASEVVRQQDGFFRHGVSHLRPLTLRTVAEAVALHESTVSRVTSNKYLHCARGTFELKYFFTSGVASSDGEGTVSAEAVKAAIRQLIDAETADAVLSDDTLVDLLKARGFDLARRTVAKYREAIGLGSSVQRRRQKALGQKAMGKGRG